MCSSLTWHNSSIHVTGSFPRSKRHSLTSWDQTWQVTHCYGVSAMTSSSWGWVRMNQERPSRWADVSDVTVVRNEGEHSGISEISWGASRGKHIQETLTPWVSLSPPAFIAHLGLLHCQSEYLWSLPGAENRELLGVQKPRWYGV